MSVGYSVSPLHRISYMDTSAMTTRPAAQDSDSPIEQVAAALGGNIGVGTPRFYSPTVDQILTWRRGIAAKYRDQLEEHLTWDENAEFEESEDVATSGDVLFHYIAAILDQRGPSALDELTDITEPPRQEYAAVFAEADQRGFSGAFPQLLLGAHFWLPIKRHLMIEEPTWEGKLARYGSVVHLVDEVTIVRAAIANAHPLVVLASPDETSDNVMCAAWLSSTAILRLATTAAAKHLPLWTTG